VRTLERSCLRGQTPQEGSGFGGGGQAWRQARHRITEAITAAGTFLDAGCANGLLMESVATWCAERGLAVEPYGTDLAPGLVDLARRRLPHWADRSGWATRSTGSRRTASASSTCTSCSTACRRSVMLT